jgi:hypothetical protein
VPRASWLATAPLAALVASASPASAAGGWVASSSLTPIEQRVAVAVGPDRTTVWTSLSLEAPAGPIGLVLPVPDGTLLDRTTDAWLEALEVATAPRVLAPEGASPVCPGEPDEPGALSIEGHVAHTASLAPVEVIVVDDVETVRAWADLYGLSLSPELDASLAARSGVRFAVARFQAPGGPALTATLRAVMPGQAPSLPLALTRAGGGELAVSTWIMGPGRASLAGATEATLDPAALVWKAADHTTNYADERAAALGALAPLGALVEAAGHAALGENTPVAGGAATIDALVATFFARASAYGDATENASLCAVEAAAALASDARVATACPRADLGAAGPSTPCVEAIGAGEIAPDELRCGGVADDLAVALSGQVAKETWVTRTALVIAEGAAGTDWPVTLGGALAVSPVLEASNVDLAGCEDGEGGGSGSSGSSGPSGSGSTTGVGYGTGATSGAYYDGTYEQTDVTCGCEGTADTVYVETAANDETYESEPTETSATEETCSGDSESSSGDDCGGDGSDSYGEEETCSGDSSGDASGDDCGGDGSESYGEEETCSGDSSGDASGDDCSGDSTGSSSDAGESCDGGSGSSGDSGCDGGSSGGDASCDGGGSDCAVGRTKRGVRMPRLSVMALSLMALLAPLRRWTRRRPPGRRGRG